MSARTVAIAPEILEILSRAAIVTNVLKLPDQLDRPTYARVDKALQALGGRWNRGMKGHSFPLTQEALAERISDLLASGEVVDTKANGYFPTPSVLIERMLKLAQIGPGQSVLEPSAGQGAIADAIVRDSQAARLCLVELLPENRAVLSQKGYTLAGDDFLALAAIKQFDRIVMNPPFVRGADVDHVTAAWTDWLAPGGRLVAIMADGIRWRTDKKHVALRELISENGRLDRNPAGSFAAVGTDVHTVMVVMQKPEDALMKTMLFVGEKRSPTAIRMNVTWESGRVCAKNLHEALAAAGIELERVAFVNLWHDSGELDGAALVWIARAQAWWGVKVVGMGLKVQAMLDRHEIEHTKLTHPAARGAIRETGRYREHVRSALSEIAS